jgi:Flp pilus assembly protein TadG
MSATQSPRPTGRRRWRPRFLHDARGAAAVEFAVVALPFLTLAVGVIEIGVDYYVFSQIDQATQQSVQEIRSGSVQVRNLTRDEFRDTVFCPKLSMLACDKAVFNVAVVRDESHWSAFTMRTVDPAAAKWCTGNPREIVLVQVAYPVPLASMIWAGDKSNVNGQRYYLAAAAFRNEPFGVPNPLGPGCA